AAGQLVAQRAVQAQPEQPDHRERQQPPRVDPVVGQRRRAADCRQRADRDQPVVTGHKLVTAARNSPKPAIHRTLLSSAPAGPAAPGEAPSAPRPTSRRSSPAYASATSAISGTRTSSAASEPGQRTPAPSAPQKTPKEVSITPTANFMAFSGTRE